MGGDVGGWFFFCSFLVVVVVVVMGGDWALGILEFRVLSREGGGDPSPIKEVMMEGYPGE